MDFQTGLSTPWTGLPIDSLNNLYVGRSDSRVDKYIPPYGGPDTTIDVNNELGLNGGIGQLVIQPPAYAAHVQPPINADGTSIFNAHRGVVSVRFTLTYGGVANCDMPAATIAVTRTAGGVTGTGQRVRLHRLTHKRPNGRASEIRSTPR